MRKPEKTSVLVGWAARCNGRSLCSSLHPPPCCRALSNPWWEDTQGGHACPQQSPGGRRWFAAHGWMGLAQSLSCAVPGASTTVPSVFWLLFEQPYTAHGSSQAGVSSPQNSGWNGSAAVPKGWLGKPHPDCSPLKACAGSEGVKSTAICSYILLLKSQISEILIKRWIQPLSLRQLMRYANLK